MAQSELVFDEPRVRENAEVRLQPADVRPRFCTKRGNRARALLLTVREAAERLGCGRTFVYELISCWRA